MNEKGALSQISSLKRKPVDMEARVMTVYKWFVDGGVEQAYQILDDLQREMETLSNEIQPIITKIC